MLVYLYKTLLLLSWHRNYYKVELKCFQAAEASKLFKIELWWWKGNPRNQRWCLTPGNRPTWLDVPPIFKHIGWYKNLIWMLKCLTNVLIGQHSYSRALSLAPAGRDEHQDKQGLASIGLLWCVSRPRPCPYEQCDGDVPTDLCWLVVPWTENQEQSVFPLFLLYIDVCKGFVREDVFLIISVQYTLCLFLQQMKSCFVCKLCGLCYRCNTGGGTYWKGPFPQFYITGNSVSSKDMKEFKNMRKKV